MAAQVAEELKTVTYSTPPMEELRKKERIHFNVFIIPFRKFGPPYLGKATAATRAAPPSPTSVCWVFSCFRNPPNSDMDYRIFLRAYEIILILCVYTRGLGTPHWQGVSTTFFTLKNSHKFFLCSWWSSKVRYRRTGLDSASLVE